jgi:four helix bundle protein
LNPPLTPAKAFDDLLVFQEARRLSADIWKLTRTPPSSADKVFVYQIRRAGLSVVSNIAEGFERGSRAEFAHFLKIAKGSCGEIRAQMLIAADQNYISADECEKLCLRAKKISAGLSNLASYLKKTAKIPIRSAPRQK